MTVIFSSPHPLIDHGPGRPFRHIRDAITRTYGDHALVLEPKDFPELANGDGLGHGRGPAFDDLAMAKMSAPGMLGGFDDSKPRVFLGGGGASLNSFNYARTFRPEVDSDEKYRVGTLWFSSHFEHAASILAAEYIRHRVTEAPIHPFLKWRARREQEQSDFLIVPSEYCKSTYPEELQGKIHVAEFGVDSEEFKPPAVKVGSDRLRVLMPATNPLRKGLAYAIEAMRGLPMDKVELTVTGWQGDDGGASRVRGVGWASNEEMRRLYQTHDIILSPSLEEGQALAVLEGAASGLVPIATPETGYDEVPAEWNGKGFWLADWGGHIESRNHEAIRSALQYFIDNHNEVAGAGRRARAWAETRPWSFFEDRIIEILEQEAS